jgi:hypothetical protein
MFHFSPPSVDSGWVDEWDVSGWHFVPFSALEFSHSNIKNHSLAADGLLFENNLRNNWWKVIFRSVPYARWLVLTVHRSSSGHLAFLIRCNSAHLWHRATRELSSYLALSQNGEKWQLLLVRPSVCLFVRSKQLDFHWTEFIKFDV